MADNNTTITARVADMQDTFFSDTPSASEANHYLRELTWEEHFEGVNMSAGMGSMRDFLYNLYEVDRFLQRGAGSLSLSSANRGSLAWIDVPEFITWIRDVVGDRELASVMDRETATLDNAYQQANRLAYVLNRRMALYQQVLDKG
jgi:hypothetical protein